MSKRPTPLLLMILDGWGLREDTPDNAISLAHPENFLRYWNDYPHTSLNASGPAVGLPQGIMGNSEVGHMNLGAGRIVYQGLSQIYHAIEDGSFFQHPVLLRPFNAVKKNEGTLHLMGLVSDGAVHSHQDHLYALLRMAKAQGVTNVVIHAFLDGRDTPPQSALVYIDALEKEINRIGVGRIATVSGRYYAMDRDQRVERTQKAYDAIVLGQGEKAVSARGAVEASYKNGITDEFVLPTVVVDQTNQPLSPMADGDAVIFFNFRPDRARQLARALTQAEFDGFSRQRVPRLAAFTCMAEYDRRLGLDVVFQKAKLSRLFPEILSEHGLTQLRIAETEKFAHVTYFFNGGEDQVFAGEDRILIPSPKEVATYDQKPEMSAIKVKEALLDALATKHYDVIILNFANPDMVGHTGIIPAATEAVRVVDRCVGEITESVLAKGGAVLITADHGNCEKMRDAAGTPHTAHTTNLVPFILVDRERKGTRLRPPGRLCDVAPTLLELLGLPKPPEMTGESLIA